jgi:hypothetical protein
VLLPSRLGRTRNNNHDEGESCAQPGARREDRGDGCAAAWPALVGLCHIKKVYPPRR